MNLKTFITILFLIISAGASGQTDTKINVTDKSGKKQGRWVKKYPNENLMYEGFFVDDHPVGEMKRYYDDKSLKSVLIYSKDGKTADASMYHPNGFISARGRYINQMKEGKWQFFSGQIKDYLISDEYYSGNMRNGPSVKYYPDGKIAEKIIYKNDVKQGEWNQYYPSGAPLLKSNYRNGKINGQFEVWFENGALEYKGLYKDSFRDGPWIIYKEDGTIKYQISYIAGVLTDNQLDDEVSSFIDSLENNKGKIADPEKTGMDR